MVMPSKLKPGIEGLGEFRVPVADQEAQSADLVTEVHEQGADALGGPGCGRVSGHTEDMHPAGAHFHHKEYVEAAQPDGVEGEEVGGQQSGGLSAQERSPGGLCSTWCRPEVGGGQDPADGAGA